MSTATLNKSFVNIGTLTDFFSFPKSQKTVTSIIKVICVTTDKKSVENSKKLFKNLEGIKTEALTLTDSAPNIVTAESMLENVNENLLKINNFFDTITYLFDGSQGEIEIDDNNMLELLDNMKQVKETLGYISDYLTLYLDVQKSKQEIKASKSKKYSFEQINALLVTA